MFSGIIEAKGAVVSLREKDAILNVRLTAPKKWRLQKGESIAIDGVCTTVVARGQGYFDVQFMPETLRKTTIGNLSSNVSVNLERSLKYGDRVHGHFVQGHVDATGRVMVEVERGASRELVISAPKDLMRFIVLHGSVSINGVSLTVSRKGKMSFTVSLIPLTTVETNLGTLKTGDLLNIEVDMLARYGVAGLGRGDRVKPHAKKGARKRA